METNNNSLAKNLVPAVPVHPGSVLQEELKERGIKQKDFAKSIGMEATHLSALIHGVRNITSGIAEKLEAGLGIPARMWLNLQNDYNLDKRKLDCVRPSSLVSGYTISPVPMAALREPEPEYNYGSKETIILTVPSADKGMIMYLASRMGWKCEA